MTSPVARPFFGTFALACLAFLCQTPVATAEYWPQYRGPSGDGVSTESIGDVDWSGSGPKVLWKVKTPLGFSSFAVADGRCFTLISEDDSEFCVALDANDGSELWRSKLGSNEYGHDGGNAGARDNRGGDGPRSTPTVNGDRVFVYDSQMTLRCLQAANGNVVWQQDILADQDGRQVKWKNASSPVLAGDLVIVGGGGEGRSFLAFDQTDGQVAWSSGDETITHATPTLALINGKQQIVFFTQSGLIGVDVTNGQEDWRVKFPFSVSTAASPVVDGSLVYCSAGYGVGAGLFEIGSSGEGDEVWFKPNELMNHWSTPLIHESHLYGMFEFKKYGRGPLQCVELATGEIKWKEAGFGPGNCIQVGDKLVALSDAGEVVIVAARPDRYEEFARADVLAGKCWSTPAYSDGRIYVRSTEEAVCIDVR